MIKVQFNELQNDVSITFDKEGAELLLELISEMKIADVDDHVHLHEGPKEINGFAQLPEMWALSLGDDEARNGLKTSDLLTLGYAKTVSI